MMDKIPLKPMWFSLAFFLDEERVFLTGQGFLTQVPLWKPFDMIGLPLFSHNTVPFVKLHCQLPKDLVTNKLRIVGDELRGPCGFHTIPLASCSLGTNATISLVLPSTAPSQIHWPSLLGIDFITFNIYFFLKLSGPYLLGNLGMLLT